MKRIKRPFVITAASLLTAYTVLMSGNDTLLYLIIITVAVSCAVAAVMRMYAAKAFLVVLISLVCGSILFTGADGIAKCVTAVSGYYTEIEGTAVTYPERTANESEYFILSDAVIDGVAVHGKIMVSCNPDESVTPGDRVSLTAKMLTSSESDGIFRYHSLSEHIYLTAFTYDPIKITKLHSDESIYTKILQLKKQISNKFSENLNSDQAAVTNALVTGNKEGLSNEILYSLRICGVSHIFAVSGMHLSIWTGIFFLIFKKKAKASAVPNIAAILFTVFYCVFTGFSSSVLRAGIMLITVFISRIIRRSADTLNTWGIAGTFLLLLNPFLAGNISFLLSYWATYALIFFNTYVFSREGTKKTNESIAVSQARKLKFAFLMSLGVIAFTLPVTALFIGYVSLLSPFASIITTPLAEAVMISSGIAAILPSAGFLSPLAFSVVGIFNDAMIEILYFLKSFDFMVVPVNFSFIFPFFVFTVFTVGLLIVSKHSKRLIIISLLISAITLTSATVTNTHIHLGETKIFIPSSENATAIAVTKDNSSAFLYGSGGSYDTARNTVNLLSRNGIFSADKLYIPRYKVSENQNTDYLQAMLFPDKITNLYKIGVRYIYSEDIWKNVSIYSDTSDSFAACILYADNIKTVICTLPSSDFSSGKDEFTSGDILICRNKIPESLHTENFKTVIVMTDKNSYNTTDRIISTSDKDMVITIKGDSYAVN